MTPVDDHPLLVEARDVELGDAEDLGSRAADGRLRGRADGGVAAGSFAHCSLERAGQVVLLPPWTIADLPQTSYAGEQQHDQPEGDHQLAGRRGCRTGSASRPSGG